MSDVSAVVMHQNEPSLARAVESIEAQTLPAEKVLYSDPNIVPVDRALNEVVRRVHTRYFVQVDSDMVLDRDCFERLRHSSPEPTGIVLGRLRDPLLGRIDAIKMFPRDAFESKGFPSTISPDADLAARMREEGQPELHVLKFEGPKHFWHTVGTHEPDYTPAYTLGRYYVQGERLMYRGHPAGAWEICRRLQAIAHPMALYAQIGLVQGVFTERTEAIRLQHDENLLYPRLAAFLEREGEAKDRPALEASEGLDLSFSRGLERGREIRDSGCPADLERDRVALTPTASPEQWFTLLGLFRGLLESPEEGPGDAASIAAQLRRFQPSQPPTTPNP